MGRIPVAFQLFSVRGECERNLPATLNAVRDIGYVGVEPWGYGGDALEWMGHPASEIRRMLDDNGLACCGMHLATGALIGDNLARTMEMNQVLGNRFLVIAWDQPRMSARRTILELAGILNSAAEALKPHGLWTGYHAHGFDFAVVEGEIAWDTLFSNTHVDVIMQLDIGNCAGGGGDPIGTLRKFPNRARSVHLKDYGGPEGSVIGEGKADWPEVFRLCEETQNTEWYVVEEGGPDGMGFDVSARSFAALQAMGKC
jgi:sugar phosphate isomerase/epimerase